MNRILLPTDFSDNARNAYKFIIEMMGNQVEEYVLLNSYEPPHARSGMLISINDILQKESEDGLRKEVAYIVETFGIDAHRIKTYSDLGDLVSVVERYLEKQVVSLLVMGTKGSGGLKEVLIGSNASAVIQNIFIPVLTVPENAEFKGLAEIALATDFVQNRNQSTLDIVSKLARHNSSKLTMVNVKKTNSKLSDEQKLTEKRCLAEYFSGIEHDFYTIENDDTVEGLSGYLKQNQVNLFVMVPRKNNFFDKIFNRSVTSKIANLASVPLLTLHDVA